MNKSEIIIYGYLAVLASFSVLYAIYVIIGGGLYATAIPVNVYLPTDVIGINGITNSSKLITQFQQLNKSAVKGVVIDVWWSLVETEPQVYNWDAYQELFSLVQQSSALKIKAVLSFHACTDSCDTPIPLPSWVTDVGLNNSDIYFQDRDGNINLEYLSFGVDYIALFPPYSSRTAVQMYSDFIQAFTNNFEPLLDSLIFEIGIGLGPNGELRYPSHYSGLWTFPGVGEFQCFDAYLQREYVTYSTKTNNAAWAHLPDSAGNYNSTPVDTVFFSPSGGDHNQSYQSAYGQFFLEWYSNRLILHGQSILSQANSVLSQKSPSVFLAAKVGCVYWQYTDPSHAAELTAGYKNDLGGGYTGIAQMFAKFGVIFDFPCFDLQDKNQPRTANASPEKLVFQTLQEAQDAGIKYDGQNSETNYNTNTYNQIQHDCKRDVLPIVGFGFRNLDDDLLSAGNWNDFTNFVDAMSDDSSKVPK